MPFTRLRASVIVPTDKATEAHEILDSALDQLVIRDIPAEEATIEEEAVDPPLTGS